MGIGGCKIVVCGTCDSVNEFLYFTSWTDELIGAIGALMNRVQQPRTLLVLGHNAGMSTAAGADELIETQQSSSDMPSRPIHATSDVLSLRSDGIRSTRIFSLRKHRPRHSDKLLDNRTQARPPSRGPATPALKLELSRSFLK